ncbi:MAG: SEL1-like repeat protein [Oscillospiraceae bacterium]
MSAAGGFLWIRRVPAAWVWKGRGRTRSAAAVWATCYEVGEGVEQSWEEAVQWYRKAAEMGLAQAQCDLAWCYEHGKGVEARNGRGVLLVSKALPSRTTPVGFSVWPTLTSYGRGVAQDWKEAVYWYQKAVDAGSAYAMCDLGVCYERGEGVQQDYAKAAELYRQAAEAGNPPGQCNLGYLYEIGQGVEQNWEEAVRWYGAAARQGLARAQCNLAWCYEYRQGRRAKWDRGGSISLSASSGTGRPRGMFCMGVCYKRGMSVARLREEAVRWYQKAAGTGYAAAQCNLGVCYERGEGVEKDIARAVELYRQAAEQEVPAGQCNLGYLYEIR